jgi:hypothetical protein
VLTEYREFLSSLPDFFCFLFFVCFFLFVAFCFSDFSFLCSDLLIIVCPFYFVYYIVCPPIVCFWLSFWYFQTFHDWYLVIMVMKFFFGFTIIHQHSKWWYNSSNMHRVCMSGNYLHRITYSHLSHFFIIGVSVSDFIYIRFRNDINIIINIFIRPLGDGDIIIDLW